MLRSCTSLFSHFHNVTLEYALFLVFQDQHSAHKHCCYPTVAYFVHMHKHIIETGC